MSQVLNVIFLIFLIATMIINSVVWGHGAVPVSKYQIVKINIQVQYSPCSVEVLEKRVAFGSVRVVEHDAIAIGFVHNVVLKAST